MATGCDHAASTETGRRLGSGELFEQRCDACGVLFIRRDGKPDGVVQYVAKGFAFVDFGDASVDRRIGLTRHSRFRVRESST